MLIDGATASVMLATGAGAFAGAVTVSGAVPDFPSDVAVTVTEPALSALTTPAPSTDAMAGSDVFQTIVRPVSTLPLASFVVALAWVVWPAVSDDAFSDTATEATATVGLVGPAPTVTGTVVDLLPSAVTVIVACPFATPVTTPLALTYAIVSSDEL
jgi:hypothetical protein